MILGLCYAEFASILSRITSSSFTYVYMSIGHMVAFIVGWNLLLEYIIGAAIVAKGVGLHLDALLNDTLKTTFTNIAPIHWLAFSSYYDFFAFGLVIAMGRKLNSYLFHYVCCVLLHWSTQQLK